MSTRHWTGTVVVVAWVLLGLIALRPAEAGHDRVRIEEVMAGLGGNATIQFVELTMLEDGHRCQATAGLAEPPPGGCLSAALAALRQRRRGRPRR